MLSNKDFVRQSLELNLFFIRILKEHLIFAASALMPRDFALLPMILNLKNQAEQLLARTVVLSMGIIGPEVIKSGEMVTTFTLKAEFATQHLTGIPITTGITHVESNLTGNAGFTVTPALEQSVQLLNQEAINLTNIVIELKSQVLKEVLACKMATYLYPLLLMHVAEEAKHYLEMLMMLQRREDMDTIREIMKHEVFWNEIMGQHAEFIRGMLDPTEDELINTANGFVKEFSALVNEAKQAMDQVASLQKLTQDTTDATTRLKNFKAQGTQGILECKIRSTIQPLLSDHVLREANHYLRMLRMFKETL